jgi:hypothetical protein
MTIVVLLLLLGIALPVLAAGADPATAATDLWNQLAAGNWVLAFGALATLLTRLLHVGGLRQKIPKQYLPWAAMVLGILSQASASMVGGEPWSKALLLGIVAGLVGIGSWELGLKKAPILRKKPESPPKAGPTVAILLIVFAVGASGCAQTFPGKVSQMSTAVRGMRQVAREAFKIRCGQMVDKCKAAKKYEKLNDCPDWQKCDNQRVEVYWVASTAQLMFDTALVLWQLEKEIDAQTIMTQAAAVFDALKDKIIKYKLLEAVR